MQSHIMEPIDVIPHFLMLVILLATVEFSSTDQFSVDEQITDTNPNEATIRKFLELHGKAWSEQQGEEQQQPKVNVQLELSKLNFSHSWERTWPTKLRALGSVSAVSFDNNDNVIVFHRGDHVWDSSTFSYKNVYLPRNKGPIQANTIIAFNRKTGDVSYEWGSNMFYMPHGLTVDHENNVWITDVAMHQVMKFAPNNRTKAELVLGTAFQPGNGATKFCKPTAVAVLPNGDFFVSDGYCNARIIKYSRNGEKIVSWGMNSFLGESFAHAPPSFFAVPHAMTLAADLGLLCVADRENGRVQCFHSSNGTFHSQFHSGIIGDRLFSVAYAPVNGGQLYVVNGPQNPDSFHAIMGFIINMQSKQVVGKFGPNDGVFDNPHDIIVSSDGEEIYIAQLSPNIVFKFISKNPVTPNVIVKSSTAIKPTSTFNNNTAALNESTKSTSSNSLQTSRQILFIIGLFVSFVCITLFAIWIITRRRKLVSRNRRRHAWDFPTVKKTDGFKLGNLLERKHGFEKLDQEASDEEPNSSTSHALLSNAQFA